MLEVPSGAPAPVVPVAEATPNPEATAVQEVVTPEGGEPESTPEKTLTQSEVNKIVAKEKAQAAKRAEKLAYERYAREAAERELATLKAERNPPPKPEGKPKASDFADPEAYVEALADWKFDQRLKAHSEQSQRESEAQRQEREAYEDAQFARKKLSAGVEKYRDYDEVTSNPEVPITKVMAKAVIESDISADVNYYLCSHIDEAERIASLPPTRQAIEIGKLEDKLKAPPVATKAPAPIVPNGTKATVPLGYSPTMSDAAYKKWREAQRAAKRNR
jgi:hypothetical protein